MWLLTTRSQFNSEQGHQSQIGQHGIEFFLGFDVTPTSLSFDKETNMQILQLDIQGYPQDWITPQQAASYYATDSVAWTVGAVCK